MNKDRDAEAGLVGLPLPLHNSHYKDHDLKSVAPTFVGAKPLWPQRFVSVEATKATKVAEGQFLVAHNGGPENIVEKRISTI